MKIGLIGHSHSVCLMDALGPWRDQLPAVFKGPRAGYSSSFDGWDAIDSGRTLIRLPARKIGNLTADFVCAVVFGGTEDYGLVRAETRPDKSISVAATPMLVNASMAFRECDVVVSVLFGNELGRRIWLDDLPRYDFIEESLPGPMREDARPIDRRYIEQGVEEYVSRVLMTCMTMRQLSQRPRFIHVMPPPPLEDPSHLNFLEGLGDAMAKHGTLPARLRLKWYRAYARAMRTMLAKGGIDVLTPPAAAFNERGFFWEDLSNGLTHGNTRYGAMVWAAIANALGSPQ